MGGFADDEIVEILHRLHPLFRSADPRTLEALNHTHAKGKFVWWARFVSRALDYAEDGKLTASIVDDVADQTPVA